MIKDFPQELLDPLARPIDPESVDARMAAQVAFESMGRTAPKDLNLPGKESEATLSTGKPKKERLFRRAATAAALGVVVVGFVLEVGRAYDYEQHVHQPSVATDASSAKR